MPSRERIETIAEMSQLRPDAKLLAISGGGRWGSMQFLEMAAILGATAVLARSSDPYQLVNKVASLLSSTGSPD